VTFGPLAGRVALVTGASRNIGAAIAVRLATDGAAVAVNYWGEDTQAEAQALVNRLTATGSDAAAFNCDVGQERPVAELIEGIETALGRVDILVNNAALSVASDVKWTDVTSENWEQVMRVNLFGAFFCARAVFPGMSRSGRGQIVNVSSVRALTARAGNIHYTASKAALLGFTRTLAAELGPAGIRVNTVVVGAIKTPEEAVYGQGAEIDARIINNQCLKRRGQPEDVAAAVSFLVSADSSFITGQALLVDGGTVMT
jgi:NAD(P)-dependent dehydrogenase (short-subunit alcohol dehydrogenase family)